MNIWWQLTNEINYVSFATFNGAYSYPRTHVKMRLRQFPVPNLLRIKQWKMHEFFHALFRFNSKINFCKTMYNNCLDFQLNKFQSVLPSFYLFEWNKILVPFRKERIQTLVSISWSHICQAFTMQVKNIRKNSLTICNIGKNHLDLLENL